MSGRPGATRQALLSELDRGPRTTSDLMAAAGVSRNAVLLSISALVRSGYGITNASAAEGRQHRGGKREGVWRLEHEPGGRAPACCIPGCGIRLNRYNAGPYCLLHRRDLATIALACLASDGPDRAAPTTAGPPAPLTSGEVAGILGVTKTRVRQLAPRLKGAWCGDRWTFDRAAVLAFQRQREAAACRGGDAR